MAHGHQHGQPNLNPHPDPDPDHGPDSDLDPNQVLGRRAAAAHLALDFWSVVGRVSTNSGDARHGDDNTGDSGGDESPGAAEARGALLFLLADNAALLEQQWGTAAAAAATAAPGGLLRAVPLPLLRSLVAMLRTGAAGAARSLLRRWLPGWAADSPDRLAWLLTQRGGEGETEAAALWAEAVAGSSLCCSKELEPMVAEARSRLCKRLWESHVEAADMVLCECEGEGEGSGERGGEGEVRGENKDDADDTGGHLAALAAAAALAVHGLTTGFCVPCTAEEAADVADGSRRMTSLDTPEEVAHGVGLLSRLAGTPTPQLRRTALAWLSRLVAIAMYRELASALPNVTAALLGLASERRGPMLRALCQAVGCPQAFAALDAHLLEPVARAAHAATLPLLTPVGAASAHVESFSNPTPNPSPSPIPIPSPSPHPHPNQVESFYQSTLYPTWHWPETFGFAPCRVGERMRRQQPAGQATKWRPAPSSRGGDSG